jgi:hypothetical protein
MVADDSAGEREPRSIPTDPMWTPITREDVLFILAQLGDGTDARMARLYDVLLHRWTRPAPATPPERHIFGEALSDEQRERLVETLERSGQGAFARIDPPDARERHAIDRFKDSRGIPRPGR